MKLARYLKRLARRRARRVYFAPNGPAADLGTVTGTQRLDRAGKPSADGDLYLRVAFDDGRENWFHHTLIAPA